MMGSHTVPIKIQITYPAPLLRFWDGKGSSHPTIAADDHKALPADQGQGLYFVTGMARELSSHPPLLMITESIPAKHEHR